MGTCPPSARDHHFMGLGEGYGLFIWSGVFCKFLDLVSLMQF